MSRYLARAVHQIIAAAAMSLLVATTPRAADVTLRFVVGNDPNPAVALAAQRFAEEVGRESQGAVDVVVPDPIPDAGERLRKVQFGAIDATTVRTMDMAPFAPAMQILDLPYLIPNYKIAYRVLDGAVGQEISGQLADKGVRNLAFWESDFRQLANSVRPVTSIEEMDGLKLSVPDEPSFKQWLRGLGAVPAPTVQSQLYDALQRREIDGQDNGVFAMQAARLYAVQPYYTLTNHVYMPVAVLVNESFFQSLSPDQQRLIRTAAENARDYQRRLSQEMRLASLAEMKRAGLKVSELSPQAIARFRANARLTYALPDAEDAKLIEEILKVE